MEQNDGKSWMRGWWSCVMSNEGIDNEMKKKSILAA